MKESRNIPVSKVKRASRFVKTGVKVGGNYIKYYSKKAFDKDFTRDELDKDNAEDIYDTLSELKGSALKMAQMLSMDKNVLPAAYTDKFALSQFSAPPLSGPLIKKTITGYFGKPPSQLFEKFDFTARNAASIGQVHQAEKDGKKLAVKIQYPGVKDSVSSDLRLVKPFATRMFGLREKDIKKYFSEVETKLLEETDYELELKRGKYITEKCAGLDNIVFPKYYPEYSAERVITMDWIDGLHLSDFVKVNKDQELADRLGQTMWDFYAYQMQELKMVHADPHPGNFLITDDEKLGVIDFGCVKEIPEDFYIYYFSLIDPNILQDEKRFIDVLEKVNILTENDTEEERAFFTETFREMLTLLSRPFKEEVFDFGDESYFKNLYEFGERVGRIAEKKKYSASRGSTHFLYINRTYYGLYNLLHALKARVAPKFDFEKIYAKA